MAVNRLGLRRITPLGNRGIVRVTIVTAALFFPSEVGAAFRWIQEVDNSGLAYPFAGLGSDATSALRMSFRNAIAVGPDGERLYRGAESQLKRQSDREQRFDELHTVFNGGPEC
jgi:hypothetical protein